MWGADECAMRAQTDTADRAMQSVFTMLFEAGFEEDVIESAVEDGLGGDQLVDRLRQVCLFSASSYDDSC